MSILRNRSLFIESCLAVVLVYVLLACAKKEDPRTIADKMGYHLPMWCLNKLSLAMHKYHHEHGRLPPAVVYSEDGVPLLSWRVLLLPYLEQAELFRDFKLDEPWDSPHNILLLPKMPSAFSPFEPSPPLEPYTTLFQVFTGKGTAFDGREGLRFKDFGTRIADTVLIVEAATAVPWTKPEDLPYDENKPLPELGAFFKDRFYLVTADACGRSFSQNIKEATLPAAIVRNGPGPGDDW